jgi:hypothetical protein
MCEQSVGCNYFCRVYSYREWVAVHLGEGGQVVTIGLILIVVLYSIILMYWTHFPNGGHDSYDQDEVNERTVALLKARH